MNRTIRRHRRCLHLPGRCHAQVRRRVHEVRVHASVRGVRIHRQRAQATLPRLEAPALPTGLAERLGAIAREEVSCDAIDRLYPSSEIRDGTRDPAVERHLTHCLRCREVFGRLNLAFSVAARHEPTELQLQRWRQIARQPGTSPLPFWLRDGRFAVAASLIMTLLLFLPFSGSSEVWRPTADRIATTAVSSAESWIDGQANQGREVLQHLRGRITEDLERGRSSLKIHGQSYTKIYDQTLRFFKFAEDEELKSFLPSQGERYG